MIGNRLRAASAMCAVLAGVWAVAMFATGQTVAGLFSAAAMCVMVVSYGAAELEAGGTA